MTNIKKSDHGIVVEHKENHLRYAVSDKNYNPAVHNKIRDLKPGESVISYQPRHKGPISEAHGGPATPAAPQDAAGDQETDPGDASGDTAAATQATEGSNQGSKAAK